MSSLRRLAPWPIACIVLLGSVSAIAADRRVRRRGLAGAPASVEVVQTSSDLSQRLTRLPDLQLTSSAPRGMPVIHVDDRTRYQRVMGFGAAMTDTSAWLLEQQLAPSVRDSVMAALFGSGGIHLNFLRVPMGASDFTAGGKPYTYDDMAGGKTDPALLRFSIAHDNPYILPALRQARAINPAVQVLASPWSPPAWMKTNQSLDNPTYNGDLRSTAGGPLARYFVKFIRDYARAGIPVAAITPQNEPTMATRYPGLQLPAVSEARWIVQDLERALRVAGLHPKIYGSDLGWGPRGTAYAQALVSSPAATAMTGIAWHCYFGQPYVMSTVRQMNRRLAVIMDECSPGLISFATAETVISSLRNWASTVVLWNLALDPRGGPVQPPNSGCRFCTGLVTIDGARGAASFSHEYYQLGQASAFIQPGAQRIDSEHFVAYQYRRGHDLVSGGLDDVAFLNPDGSRVLLAYDNSPRPIGFGVSWQGRGFAYTLPARAMGTFVWNRP